jgi:hypothetical protein
MSHLNSQSILCIKPNWFGTGLCNQLFFIISAIIIAHQKKMGIVCFDNFLLEPMTDKKLCVGKVIDLEQLNQSCQKYNVSLCEKNDMVFKLCQVLFGNEENYLDITEIIKEKFVSNNQLLIPAGTILNDLAGDPCPGVLKTLRIEFLFNGKKYIEIHPEYLWNSIDIAYFHSFQNWHDVDINTHDPKMFNEILQHIQFHPKYQIYIDNVLKIPSDKKINVIHIRLENDMTGHMAKENKMDLETYRSSLESVYIQGIQQYFSKEDLILVLSFDFDNKVVEYLKKEGYSYFTTPKNFFNGREQHAIVDLLIGEMCTGTFIGNWNHSRNVGSTYSYVLGKRIKDPNAKQVYVDMYDISSKPKEFGLEDQTLCK